MARPVEGRTNAPALEGSPNGMAAVLKTAVPQGTWGFKSLTLRFRVHSRVSTIDNSLAL